MLFRSHKVKDIKNKIEQVGGSVKILYGGTDKEWDGSFQVVMYHPVYFKQGYLIKMVGDQDNYKLNEEIVNELKCWPGYHRVKGTKAGFPGSCAKNKNEGVAEGVNDYLWHGSRNEHKILYPRQANDTGGKEESNKNAIYATPSAKVAIAMGLTTPGSDTGMFPNDPQMVLFKGGIRKGQMVYLHKVPKNLFIKHNSREWYSKPEVTEIKPLEVKAIPVDRYLNLIRQATPADLELQKKYMKQGVAEAQSSKAGIVQTDVYGTSAYHAKCLEPNCDWESKRYDKIGRAHV